MPKILEPTVDHDETPSEADGLVRKMVPSHVEQLYREHGDDIETVAQEMKPCNYCETQHYEEFIVRE